VPRVTLKSSTSLIKFPRRATRTTSISRVVVVAALASFTVGPTATAQVDSPSARPVDPRWTAIRRVFGQEGEAEGAYFRVNLPRNDLHVRIGSDTLAPGFELTSYVGFMPSGARDVMAMGEVIVREDELPVALAELHRQGVRVSAVHNHLVGETPRIMYVHVVADGPAEAVASKLKSVVAKTSTPLTHATEGSASVDWSAIDGILGKHAEAEDRVAEYVFPRRERLTVHGMAVRSTGMLETASEVVFQQLGADRMACGGELFVLPSEVAAVVRALDEHGLHVTAVHNHMVDDTPRMYWIHWYATGDATTLARGVRAALAHMNSAQQSTSED
jgi:hypothetical protein